MFAKTVLTLGTILLLGLSPMTLAQTTPPPPIPTVGVTCKVAWDQPPSPDLAGHRLYKGLSPKNYVKGTFVKPLPAAPSTVLTTHTATCADFGIKTSDEYFLAVTAYDALGNESAFSPELAIIVDATASPTPTNLHLVTITVTTATDTP